MGCSYNFYCGEKLVSLGKKNLQLIIGGFFIILGLLILLGAVALNANNTLAKQTRDLYQHPFAVSNALLETNVKILEIRQHLLEIIVAPSNEQLEKSIAHMNEYEADVYKYFETIEQNFLGDPVQFQKLFEAFADWKLIRSEIITLVQAGRSEEAMPIVMEGGRGGRHFIMLSQEIQDMVEFAHARAADFMSKSIAAYQQNHDFLIAMILVVALALITVFLFGILLLNAMFKKLMESEAQFQELYEKTPVLLHSVDKRGIIINVSDHWLGHFGYRRDEVIGQPLSAFFSKKSWHYVEKVALPKLRETGKVKDLELEFVTSSGEIHLVCITTLARYAKDGSFDQSLSVLEDLTERRQVEQVIHHFDQLIEHSVNEIYIFDSETFRFIEVSKGAIKNLGYSMEELTSMTPLDLKPEFTRESFEALICPLRTGEQEQVIFETVHRRKDGSEYPVEVRLHFAQDAGTDIFFAIIADITERRRAAQVLEESEQRLAASMTNMTVGAIVIKDDGTILEFNPFAESLFGYEAAEVVGKNIRMLMPEPYRSGHDQYLRSYLDTGIKKIIGIAREVEGLRKGGETFPMRLGIGEIGTDNGSLFIGSVIDLTEVKSLEFQLRHAQKMEAVGQLTGGIAHDFNNILGIVMGNLELLQLEVADEPKILDRIQKAIEGTERGASLTRSLLGFSRRGATETKLTNVNKFIRSLQQLIAKSLTPSIKVQNNLAADLWPVVINPSDFADAALNLALNARDAMPEGGALMIETANKILDEHYVKRNPQASTGEFVMIAVSDTGVGMTDEVLARAFEPFFTTKDQGEGTGMGLSMVYGFVQRSDGHVKIYSEVGAGTTVRIYLPRADEETIGDKKETSSSQDTEGLPVGSETILVVDDEVGLVDVATLHLEGFGYRALSASDGRQALKILEDHPEIDLLFADVVMPGGLDGYRLAQAALKIRPSLKILLVSGFIKKREEFVNDGKEREEFVSDDDSVLAKLTRKLLNKPYTRTELARAIRRTLDERNDDET